MTEEAEATDYLKATEKMLWKLVRWKQTHDQHDHADETVAAACLREWGYLEHQTKILIGSGPAWP